LSKTIFFYFEKNVGPIIAEWHSYVFVVGLKKIVNKKVLETLCKKWRCTCYITINRATVLLCSRKQRKATKMK
jgi:hypothetical protein